MALTTPPLSAIAQRRNQEAWRANDARRAELARARKTLDNALFLVQVAAATSKGAPLDEMRRELERVEMRRALERVKTMIADALDALDRV